MYILVVIFHVIVSLAIIAIVLLQAGKGADIGSAFGGAGSQAVFGSMSAPTLLGKVTTVVALICVLTSFGLSMMASRRASTIMTNPPPAQQAPAQPPGQQ